VKRQKGVVILPILIIIILLGVAGYFAYQNYQLRWGNLNVPLVVPTSTSKFPITDSDSDTANDSEVKQSTLEEIDNIWNLYTNRKFGFSIKIPKKSDYWVGGCTWEAGGNSPGKEKFSASVGVNEDENSVYISHEYMSMYTRKNNEDGTVDVSCKIVPTTLEELKKQRQTYQILVGYAENDQDLESFIQSRFGDACGVGEKTITDKEGVLNVRVKMDGDSPATSKCFVNYVYRIRYDTNSNKVYTWDIGQEVTFQDDNYPELQNEMDESFRVL